MGQKEKIQVKNIADLEVLLINDIRIKYGIQVLNIKKMELGTAKCYEINADKKKYFVKIYQKKHDCKQISREIRICDYLKKRGMSVSEYIKNSEGNYINIQEYGIFTVQNFIDGITYEKFHVPMNILYQSGEILAQIHDYLDKISTFNVDFSPEWIRKMADGDENMIKLEGVIKSAEMTELLERQIAAGTDGILTLGTTGEYSTMSHEEDAAVVEHTIRVVDGRVPVMVGSGSNCTVTQIEKSRLYQSMGADALLLISPYYNKANAEGMYRHFAETADAVDIPCILYNVPGRTGCSIPVSVVERLARHPNIAGIKEASGDMSYAMKIARCVGPDFALYSGNDDITVPILSIGGSGVISVYANVMPAMCRQIVADWLDGNHARALENHLRYLQLMNDLFLEVNPIPVKAAMNMMGLDVGPMRLPLCEMGEANAATLRRTLEEAGLL